MVLVLSVCGFTPAIGPDSPAHEDAGQLVDVVRVLAMRRGKPVGVVHVAPWLARLVLVEDWRRFGVDGLFGHLNTPRLSSHHMMTTKMMYSMGVI